MNHANGVLRWLCVRVFCQIMVCEDRFRKGWHLIAHYLSLIGDV